MTLKVSRAQSAENRKRILDVAARMFRAGGFGGTGVDAVMNAAGLTHGGFYTHFQSKDKLAAEACSQSVAQSLELWAGLAESKNPVEAILDHYLSVAHRDDPGAGCLIPALGPDVSRSSPEVRHAFTVGVKSLLEVLARNVPGGDQKTQHANALNLLTAMVGAIMLARAVDDSILSGEILEAASKSLKAANASVIPTVK